MPTSSADHHRESWAALAVGHGVPQRSFVVALVVGTILNLINQGDAIWSDANIDGLKLGLSYIVPYCVATYGAITAYRHFD